VRCGQYRDLICETGGSGSKKLYVVESVLFNGDIKRFPCRDSSVADITEDHLDRYDTGFENYQQ